MKDDTSKDSLVCNIEILTLKAVSNIGYTDIENSNEIK